MPWVWPKKKKKNLKPCHVLHAPAFIWLQPYPLTPTQPPAFLVLEDAELTPAAGTLLQMP